MKQFFFVVIMAKIHSVGFMCLLAVARMTRTQWCNSDTTLTLHAFWEFWPSRNGYISRGPSSSLTMCAPVMLKTSSHPLPLNGLLIKHTHTHVHVLLAMTILSLSECPLRKSTAVANSLIFSLSHSAPSLSLEYINTHNLPLACPLWLTGFIFLLLLPDIHRRRGVLWKEIEGEHCC